MSLIAELRHRSVFKIATAYLVVGWLVLEVASQLFDNFGAPDWFVQSFSALILLGFPIACVVAWAFEATPEGVVRSQSSEYKQQSSWFDYLWAGLLMVTLVIAAANLQQGWRAAPQPAVPIAEEVVIEDSGPVSIAVLPFVNMSSDPEQEYFADGLSEELLNLLTQVPQLKVTGRTSSFAFKGRNEDLRKIGAALGVTRVLEGSVRLAEERVRITAQLINVADGFHIWSSTYDRELTDIFAIQDEISAAITAALQIHLGVEAPSRGLPTENMQAYNFFLQGIAAKASNNRVDAVAAFKQAIELDPGFAEAHFEIAETHMDFQVGSDSFEQRMANVRKHLELARALDPTSAKIRAYAKIIMLDSTWPPDPASRIETRLTALRQALETDPGNSMISGWEAYSLLTTGFFSQSLAVAEAALIRDPLFINLLSARAGALHGLGRKQEAREAELFVAEQTGEYGLYWIRSLDARTNGNTELADQQLALLAEKTGQDAAATKAGQLMLIDPATRDMVLQSPGMQAAPSFLRLWILFVLQDERFWPELAAMEDAFPVLHQVIPTRSPWLLSDPRLRPILEQFGSVGFWLKHGLPEFCDGQLESWICELPVEG